MVIDAEAAAEQGDQITFIPTYARLGNLAKQELTDVTPEEIDAVMTPEYSEEYARLSSEAKAQGLELSKPLDFDAFTESEGLTPDAERALEVRSRIEAEFGANPHFLGNGLTKNLDTASATDEPYGTLETFTYDRNPQTLGALEASGALMRQGLSGPGKSKT